MNKVLIAFVGLLMLFGCGQENRTVYLFTSFHEPAHEGLRLLYSYDGYRWDSIPGVLLVPTVGEQKIMRDPSMVKGADGRFHLVWTCSWKGDLGFGYASSTDLIHWSEQQHIPIMSDTTTVNVWAPELFFDDERNEFLIVWASTIPFKYDKGVEDEYNNHRLYVTKTTDFNTFSPPSLLYDPGYSSIDAVIVKRGKADYALVFKDNTRPERDLKVAFGSTPTGPYSNPTAPFTDKLTEGPAVVKLGNQWLIYYDAYGSKSFEAVSTTDFKTFTDVTKQISLPEGHKHGTIIETTASLLNHLKAARP